MTANWAGFLRALNFSTVSVRRKNTVDKLSFCSLLDFLFPTTSCECETHTFVTKENHIHQIRLNCNTSTAPNNNNTEQPVHTQWQLGLNTEQRQRGDVEAWPWSSLLSLEQSTLMYCINSMSWTSTVSSEHTVSSCNLVGGKTHHRNWVVQHRSGFIHWGFLYGFNIHVIITSLMPGSDYTIISPMIAWFGRNRMSGWFRERPGRDNRSLYLVSCVTLGKTPDAASWTWIGNVHPSPFSSS